MPKASVVIPCYNAEKYVAQTVRSAQEQTMSDIEIICVDDGSTDGTLAVLRNLAAADPRIHVISQPNGGEGPARDTGLAQATGEWLYFLDADDLMMPTLLETAIMRGEDTQADIVVFRTMMLDDQTGERWVCDWSFKRDWTTDDVFSPSDYPDHIFNSFQNWVHNKLFRGSFIRRHDLHIQHVHRTADLLFTCSALALAQRIALLDVPLHDYRVNNPKSAMATSDSYPLDFYEAFVALRAFLEDHGLWQLYRTSFVNWAIEGVAVNLRFARSYEGYRTIADTMLDGGLRALDIEGFPRDASDAPRHYDQVAPLADGDLVKSLFVLATQCRSDFEDASTNTSYAHVRIDELKEKLKLAREELARRSEELEEQRHAFVCVTSSVSFKMGRAITFVPRSLARIVRNRSN